MICAGYTDSKNQVRNRLKIKFVEVNFSKLIWTQKKFFYVVTEHIYLDFIQEIKGYRNSLKLPLRLWVAFFLFLFLINFLFNFFLFFPWLMFPCSPLCPKRRCAVIWKRKLIILRDIWCLFKVLDQIDRASEILVSWNFSEYDQISQLNWVPHCYIIINQHLLILPFSISCFWGPH